MGICPNFGFVLLHYKMADSDLMSYIEDPNHQWQPLQPTSTPSVFMAETPDPVVHQYMSHDFDPLLPRPPPGNMSDFGFQCPPWTCGYK